MNNQQFHGKVALVTGGSSGIGEACALTFARGGAKVVIVDLNSDQGEKVVTVVKQADSDAIYLKVDVSDPKAVKKMIEDTLATFGRLDIAVNNAGILGERNPTSGYSIEGWHKVIDINLNGVFYCMRNEILQMLKHGSGSIVNMSSIEGTVGVENSPAYVATKHGVVGLTKAAALENGKQGIRINSVGPGFIETPLLNFLDEESKTRLSELHAVERMGKAQEVANLVGFLCSDQASFLTGGHYLVDGGYTAQ